METLRSVDDVPAAEWDDLTRAADVDSSRGFIQFREYLEPGDPLLLVARRSGRLRGAVRGVLGIPQSGLSSNPWKFIGADAVLRVDERAEPEEAAALRRTHRELVYAVAGERPDADEPSWQLLTRRIGPCLVVREFERSEVLCHPDLAPDEAERLTADLVRALQTEALANGAGAVSFPYVRPGDTVLRRVLTEAGFRSGVMTAGSAISTAGHRSYEEYLAALPSRYRRRYRNEEQQLQQADDLHAVHLDLAEHVERVAELEAQTLSKHGGPVDPRSIQPGRRELARRLPDAVRVPAIERDGRTIAFALHLLGPHSVLFMTYGCDYSVPDRGMSYPWVAFYQPVRMAIEAGAQEVRLGLEALEAKTRRGAVVEPRETWLWTPDPAALKRLGELLDLVDTRNTAYLSQFTK